MSSSQSSPSSPPPTSTDSPPSNLPLKKIPGDYGLPFLGPVKDRYDYFYNQGKDEFFRSRIRKYNSTIFRTNMPPGPFIAHNPKVVAVLDAVSFPVLFDTTKVEKKNVFDGTFFPSTAFTGGYRVCSYLDPSEPNHAILKGLFLSLLAARHNKFIPLLQNSLSDLFTNIEDSLSKTGKANFNTLSDNMSFSYLFRLFCDRDPSDTRIGSESNGSKIITSWLFLQLAPLFTLGLKYLPNFLEDFLLHTFPLPFFPVKSGYEKIYDGFYVSASKILDEAEKLGMKRDEACHNLVFMAGFNSYGGMKVIFPVLIKWVASAGESLQRRLLNEIRTVVKSEGGVTYSALNKMSLVKSVVYEALRIDPPVLFQYGHAKVDMVVHSHDAAFEIKKGEMIFGYQPCATRDGRVFENPDEFVGDRFVGGEGEKLLKYVYWSNGRETDDPTTENKQCPAKDMVVLLSRVMLVELFLRYDTFTAEVGTSILGVSVTIKSLTKAWSSA
ncbi:hypothetical protein Vadar_013621 [Vaccinium darrowii]|uniref:Uncharacterized protein n=1 Tax=Vaccinium darrowii TaxID=229202 RepID=A0ACB7X0E1_9ERIC|nr:hypothetical protein Vadar_013621 [Vaccinium darrowii]